MHTALHDPLARIAELQAATGRIDVALENARLTWLRSAPTDEMDKAYEAGVERLAAIRQALEGEIAAVRLGALL